MRDLLDEPPAVWEAERRRGGGERSLLRVPGSAANPETFWSPDGERVLIAYGRPGIWIMRADGTQARASTRTFGDNEPTWSSDGRSIAFSRADWDIDGANAGIYVMNADGSRLRKVALGSTPSSQPTQ